MKNILIFIAILTAMILLSSGVFAVESKTYIDETARGKAKSLLLTKHGESEMFRIEKGVKQTADLWIKEDGDAKDYVKFCVKEFLPQGKNLDATFARLEKNFENIYGNLLKIMLDLKRPLHLDWGKPLGVDWIFAEYSPFAHVSDDFFTNKIAFIVRLNFPYYTLEEKTELGEKWSRKEWAFARMGDKFNSRIPAAVNQKVATIMTQADNYISAYNIHMGNLIDDQKKTYFQKDKKLITHWGLRDELKANYQDKDGMKKQEMIFSVMKRIINQEIPAAMIDKDDYLWNPFTNKMYSDGVEVEAEREPDTRYRHLLNTFKASQLQDKYNPNLPTHVKRKFEADREIPEKAVEKLFIDFVSSGTVKKIGKLIEKKLDRKLKPFDIWYVGFRSASGLPEAELDKIVTSKYPSIKEFQKDIPNILLKLGFSKKQSEFLAPKIKVEASRGAGHAWGAEGRDEQALLRTRVPKNGMNYKGFNIAIHELGHCVEQTFTLHTVDYYAMHGIPNTALTEAFAFVFQGRDLEVLGVAKKSKETEHLKALHSVWSSYEIMGVSLVDMKVWNWMYSHPEATAAELKAATVIIAKDIWNKYYAPVFGVKDQEILAVYSHMIDARLYLPDYPIGHLVEYQIHRYLEGKNLGEEMERMCSVGILIPQLWMKNAVGSGISAKPMLEAAEEALEHIK